MKKLNQRWTARLSILVAAALLLAGTYAGWSKFKSAAKASAALRAAARTQPVSAEALSVVKNTLGKLPMAFEANRGQTDAQVKYLAHGIGYTVFLTEKEAVLRLKTAPATSSMMGMKFV